MKKILSFALVLTMLLSLAAVSQATAPSRTVNDLTTVDVTYVEDDTIIPPLPAAAAAAPRARRATTNFPDMPVPLSGLVIEALIEQDPAVAAELLRIGEFLSANNVGVFNYFTEEVQQQILALVPVGFDTETLALNELVTMQMTGYAEGAGEVWTAMEFATQYREGQVVVPLVGIIGDNGEIEYFPLEAEVGADAKVNVKFPADVLLEMSAKPFAFGILSEP